VTCFETVIEFLSVAWTVIEVHVLWLMLITLTILTHLRSCIVLLQCLLPFGCTVPCRNKEVGRGQIEMDWRVAIKPTE